jgi:hypothetical protein
MQVRYWHISAHVLDIPTVGNGVLNGNFGRTAPAEAQKTPPGAPSGVLWFEII